MVSGNDTSAFANDIPVYVVSLQRANERRSKIQAALDELGIPFTFKDAVDAATGVPAVFEKDIDRRVNSYLSEREYGCALSHAGIYRHMVETHITHAIVMEDDAIPLPALRTFIEQQCYKQCSLVQLYHNAAYIKRAGHINLFDDVIMAPLAMSCSGTVAYSLDLRAARALDAATHPVHHKADWPVPPIVSASRDRCDGI